jgi:DNA-binding GntR family transcriptional regulator
VHRLLRENVLSGRYVPGTRLAPAVIAKEEDASLTVVREALTMLANEGFVTIKPNHGYFVPHLSLTELSDLTAVRCRNESLAVELAVERGTLTWESEVLAAHHRLAGTPRRNSADPAHFTEDWAEAHRELHATIVAACGVSFLVDVCATLAAQTELYRRWAAPSRPARSREVETEHAEIVDAVLDRDAARASDALTRHYTRTLEVILDAGLLPEVASTS